MLAGAFTVASPAQAGPIAWCGTGEPSTDLPDALSAIEWHIIYAIPADGQDRFAYFAPRIAGDVAAVSNWWIGQDPTRRPRYDLIDAPGCASDFQRVDITVAHLPHANADESFTQIETDLRAQGFASADKGYLVYYDGSLDVSDEYGVCGQGSVIGGDGPWAYSIVFLQSCFQTASDDFRAQTAAHEMVHGMGAVEPQAPHYCNNGHVCDSPNDLMKAVAHDGDSLSSEALDVGRDDYYGHSGSWFDVQDSGLLFHLDLTLPPAPPVTATATNIHDVVRVNWFPVPSENGLYFRVYGADGKLIQNLGYSTLTVNAATGQTLTWTIQSEDIGGFFGPPTTLRFKVGYGIVDATGTLTKDTVAPGDVVKLRATRSGRTLSVGWAPVSDPIGLRGYKVTAPGLKPLLVKSASVKLPLAGVRGKKITVVAVDEAGNAGYPASIVPRR
jgi:hypothetical protein